MILNAEDTTLSLRFPRHWLEEHPLTLADLEQEQDYFRAGGYELKLMDN